ncbi:hypothetical protein HX13_01175 [Chryseobacterium sp. P1-3]|uniref:hypothetical protein n=1 Tax=Chryseobacterium sp. (strain P1-3) TaxID=1517683 RepID=UPI0004E79B85|nr:hypothetical protein [Chryseobacterium sp. P1-3]KFF75996.1 hypothetical protein HX13_01175 [Chryseobacterium sp. P1-3]
MKTKQDFIKAMASKFELTKKKYPYTVRKKLQMKKVWGISMMIHCKNFINLCHSILTIPFLAT